MMFANIYDFDKMPVVLLLLCIVTSPSGQLYYFICGTYTL